jgi:divinyl chlorophyllide a 8-vinyl-reductase
VGRVCSGEPYVTFGDGTHTRANPISARDLGVLLADCLDTTSVGLRYLNRAVDCGGPGPPLSPAEQAALLFGLLNRDVATVSVPLGVLGRAVDALDGAYR